MIDRLIGSLDWIAGASPTELRDVRPRGDAADALRLALDCLQQELSRDQRTALERVWELVEDGDVAPAVLIGAARRARDLLRR